MGVFDIFKKLKPSEKSPSEQIRPRRITPKEKNSLPVEYIFDDLTLYFYFTKIPKDFNGAIRVTRNRAMDEHFLSAICEHFPNLKEIRVDNESDVSPFNPMFYRQKASSELYTRDEIVQIKGISDKLMQRHNVKMKFYDGFSVDQAIVSSLVLNDVIDEINNARIDGEPLTPLEKYLYAYDFVTQFVYNEDEEDRPNARNLISVLTTDKIVCLGYSSLLTEICKGIGIDCERINVNAGAPHAACIVRIKDEAYGIDQEFYSDPCFDSRDDKESSSVLTHALMTQAMLDHRNECGREHGYNPYKPVTRVCPLNLTKLKAELDKIDNSDLKEKDPRRYKDACRVADDFLFNVFLQHEIDMYFSDVTSADLNKEMVRVIYNDDELVHRFYIDYEERELTEKITSQCPILSAVVEKLTEPKKQIRHPLNMEALKAAQTRVNIAKLSQSHHLMRPKAIEERAARLAEEKMENSIAQYDEIGYFDDDAFKDGPFYRTEALKKTTRRAPGEDDD